MIHAKGKSPTKQPIASRAGRRIAVIYLAIDELKLNPLNPRVHTPRQIRQIALSIETFGFNVPILIDADGNVIAGHGRLLACLALGWTEVPTICLDHLSETQARAFTITDNRLTDNSLWNERLLAEALKDLSVVELDFSLEVTGFEMGEIDLRIESLDHADDEGDSADAIPSNSGPPVSQPGDLWRLGEHRVLCGSAFDPAAYVTLMGNERAAMVFTDPPYNVRIDGHATGLGRVHHREFAMAAGEMDDAEFTTFLRQACALMARNSTDGSLHFICMDWRHMRNCLQLARNLYRASRTFAFGRRTMPGWGRFTEANMNWSSFSNMGAGHTETTFSWGNTAATAPMYGNIQVPLPLRAAPMRAISLRCIRQ